MNNFVIVFHKIQHLRIQSSFKNKHCMASSSGFGIWDMWSHAHTSAHAWNIRDVQKKAHFVWFKKLQGVWQITHLKQQCFLSFTFCKTQRSYKKFMCLFFISLVQWWKLHVFILFTWRTTDFKRIKKKQNDGTIIFLTSSLNALTWKILLLFSIWFK